jgi:molybdate transport system substrate-binding protein
MSAFIWLLLTAVLHSQPPLTVSAAISLTEALTEIAEAYEHAGGGPVRFNFGASNVLARQIVNGAPVDVFISADEAQMDVVERAGLIDPASRSELVTNRLAVLVRKEIAAPVREARGLAHPEIRRIAIGNPDAVPAGVYARQWLTDAGVWSTIEEKIVPVGSVRAALAAVESGSVDAAIVYRSDTLQVRSASVAFVVTSGAPRISYPAAIVKRTTRRDEATRFLAFIRGDGKAKMIFIKHKFAAEAR